MGGHEFSKFQLDQEWGALLASLLISLTSATKFSNFHCVAYSSYIESPSLVKVQTSPLSTLHHPCLLATCKNGLLLVCTTLGNGFDHTSACELWGVFCEAIIRNRWVSWLQNLSQQMLWPRGGAISNYFRSSQFENIFSNRNSLEVDAHEVGFWDYQSFITASADYQPYGFGTTYRKLLGMKELAAFLAHVATKTSCKL